MRVERRDMKGKRKHESGAQHERRNMKVERKRKKIKVPRHLFEQKLWTLLIFCFSVLLNVE